MKKIVFISLLSITSSILISCNQRIQYIVSEREINQMLKQHNNFSKKIKLLNVISIHVVITNLISQIGREESNKIILSGNINFYLRSLFSIQNGNVKLKIKALPVFRKNLRAIFLQELEIVNSEISPEIAQSALCTLIPHLDQFLRNYFDQNPIYVFHENKKKHEEFITKRIKDLKVKPGKIIFFLH